MISFKPHLPNQLLLNPKLPNAERNILVELKEKFESRFSHSGFFLIASSGSSKRESESVKLISISHEAILNSARRFNQFFGAERHDIWGLVLPTFHVAGLSVLARAFLVSAQVVMTDWTADNMENWLKLNSISFLSLVPAQVYDLVQRKIQAPLTIKKVFVGAGALSTSLRADFRKLGWPVVETYGMTETCSMIAIRENQRKEFSLLPGVRVQCEEGFLKISCDSLAHSAIQKKQGDSIVTLFASDWLLTEDRARVSNEGIEFLGRSSEYIKVLGEGVSLPELREKLDEISLSNNRGFGERYLFSVADERTENLLVLVVQNTVPEDVAEKLVAEFNRVVRGYEKIHKVVRVAQIPLTNLGKIKIEDLKVQVMKQLSRRLDDKKV